MPVVSATTQTQILAGWLGPGRAVGTEDSYDVELWTGDARDVGSAVVTCGGVDVPAVEWDSDDWALSGTQIQSTGLVQFEDAADEYDDTATHYVLRDRTTLEVAWCAPLAEPLDVTGAGTGPAIRPIVFFADAD